MEKKRTKLIELIKEFELKSTDGLNGLKARGMRFTGFNQYVEEEEIDSVKQALFDTQQEVEERAERLKELSKAKFLGVVKDKNTGRFKRYLLKLDLSVLESVEHDLVEIGECSTIFGAKLELSQDLLKGIIADPNDFE